MGNIFVPRVTFQPGEIVEIRGFSFSKEHVPKEITKYGTRGKVVENLKLMKSQQTSPEVFATRVLLEGGIIETFFTNDLRKS